MKNRLFFVGVIFLAAAAGLWFAWPYTKLVLAKHQAIQKLSPESKTFNVVPSRIVTNILRSDAAPLLATGQLSGYAIALPAAEFFRSTNAPARFTNSQTFVAITGPNGQETYGSLQRELGCSNVLDLLSEAYFATVPGISQQRTMAGLKRHLALLNLKALVIPRGAEHSWQPFDRGDFMGYVAGDWAKDRGVVVDIYIKERDEFVCAFIKKQAKEAVGDMFEVYHILSELRIEPKPGGP
jgi:hypothetical protein